MNINTIELGDLYISEDGKIFKIVSYCESPTVTLESIENSRIKIDGGIGGITIDSLKAVNDLDKDGLIKILNILVNRGINHQKLYADIIQPHMEEKED